MKRALLVEDHAVFRQALAQLLTRNANLDGIFQAGSLAEARSRLGDLEEGDVVVVDLLLPDGDGLDLIRELRESDLRVCVLTAIDNREFQARMLAAGADEVLSKNVPVAWIVTYIERPAGLDVSPLPEPQRRSRGRWSFTMSPGWS
jgi:DNA-binding NarL/FixJ family response regulator